MVLLTTRVKKCLVVGYRTGLLLVSGWLLSKNCSKLLCICWCPPQALSTGPRSPPVPSLSWLNGYWLLCTDSMEVLITTLPPRMCFKWMLPGLQRDLEIRCWLCFMHFVNCFWLCTSCNHEGHSFRRLKLNNNFTPGNSQLGPPILSCLGGQYSGALQVESHQEAA